MRDRIEILYGLREPVTMRLTTWSGAEAGEGTATDVDTPVSPDPQVKWPGMREILRSGGMIPEGSAEISKVSLTYTLADLLGPELEQGQQFYYVIRGRNYVRTTEPDNNATGWKFMVQRA
jgi:hypothetical protein